MDELADFLKHFNLSQYYDAIKAEGADDLGDLRDLDDEETNDIAESAKMKKLHKKKFIKAVQAVKNDDYPPDETQTQTYKEKTKSLFGSASKFGRRLSNSAKKYGTDLNNKYKTKKSLSQQQKQEEGVADPDSALQSISKTSQKQEQKQNLEQNPNSLQKTKSFFGRWSKYKETKSSEIDHDDNHPQNDGNTVMILSVADPEVHEAAKSVMNNEKVQYAATSALNDKNIQTAIVDAIIGVGSTKNVFQALAKNKNVQDAAVSVAKDKSVQKAAVNVAKQNAPMLKSAAIAALKFGLSTHQASQNMKNNDNDK